MKFTKHQIQVLTMLHLVAAVMILGVFLMPRSSSGGGPDVPAQGEQQDPSPAPETPVHDKFRDPRIAFDEDIFWETNIGGSGSESVENAYEIGDKLYIIGNTDSTDLDFEEASGNIFLCVMSKNGKPLAYNFYGGRLMKSALHQNGIFCLTQDNDKYGILVIDANGVVKAEKELALNASESAKDFIIDYETGVVSIIIEVLTDQLPKERIQILALSEDFEPLEGIVLPSVFPLKYVAALPRENGYMIAVNASGAKTGELILYEWKASADKLYTEHACAIENRLYSAIDIIPYEDGYAALIIDDSGVADLLTVDYDLSNPKIILLNSSGAKDGKLYSDNKNNYVYLRFENGTSKTYKMPPDLKSKTELVSFETQTEISAFRFSQTDTYFGGKNAYSPVISILNNQGVLFEKAFGATTETIKALLPSDGFIYAICESSGVSLNVGKNFGKEDILVVKIRFI